MYMNPKAKGSRNERKSRDLLTALGYNVTKSGGSLGQWDLIGIGTTDAVLVQVKSNRPPCPAEREALELFPCPQNFRKLIHVWKDYARQPQVQVVGV